MTRHLRIAIETSADGKRCSKRCPALIVSEPFRTAAREYQCGIFDPSYVWRAEPKRAHMCIRHEEPAHAV